jgi:transcriptional regulator with XRE-family HTH domain
MRRNDVGARPTSRQELADWYGVVLVAQARSGLSVAEYAERVGVTGATLYQWRRRLGEGRGGRAKLVEVAVAGPAGRGEALVVRLSDGRRSIEVSRGFDDEDLRRLIAVLESC